MNPVLAFIMSSCPMVARAMEMASDEKDRAVAGEFFVFAFEAAKREWVLRNDARQYTSKNPSFGETVAKMMVHSDYAARFTEHAYDVLGLPISVFNQEEIGHLAYAEVKKALGDKFVL